MQSGLGAKGDRISKETDLSSKGQGAKAELGAYREEEDMQCHEGWFTQQGFL